MAKKIQPVSFDSWLGKVIDDEAAPHGGRAAIAEWIGVSEQSVNRRARGEVPYLAREVELVAQHIDVPTAELVERALARFGGIEKLIAEYGPNDPMSEVAPIVPIDGPVTPADNVTYLGRVTPPLNAAADDDPRTPPKE